MISREVRICFQKVATAPILLEIDHFWLSYCTQQLNSNLEWVSLMIMLIQIWVKVGALRYTFFGTFLTIFSHTTRLLGRRSHSLSQHTQFLKMRMIFFFWNFDTFNQTNTLASCSLRSRAFCASRSRKFSKKKSVSQSTQNALKRI